VPGKSFLYLKFMKTLEGQANAAVAMLTSFETAAGVTKPTNSIKVTSFAQAIGKDKVKSKILEAEASSGTSGKTVKLDNFFIVNK
jgi:hypothetical protein